MKAGLFILLLAFLFCSCIFPSTNAEIIPADRRIDWSSSNVGVPGGIPNRTTNCVTTACNILYGGNVTPGTINAAITSAPANSVVRIPAGTYQLDAVVKIERSNVVLRGAGMGQTILDIRHSGGTPVVIGGYVINTPNRIITSGSTKGSTSFTASDVSNVRPGLLLLITEDNEPFIWSRGGYFNLLQQVVHVESVAGTTVTFSPPLVYDFSHNPNFGLGQSYSTTDWGYNVGIEDLTINGTTQTTNEAYSIAMWGAYASWIRNIEIHGFGDVGIFLYESLQNTIQGCYIHGPVAYNEGYGVYLYAHSTGNLVEDNSFADLWVGVMGSADVGNVISYNYVTKNLANVDWPYQVMAYNEQHGPQSMMNLWEGNVGQGFQNDGYHGSGSHATLFRNNFHGVSQLVSSLGATFNYNRKMIDLDRFSYYHNVIGNVLGDSSWTPAAYEMIGNQWGYDNQPVIYRLGYPNMGNNWFSLTNPPSNADDGGFDPEVTATILRHGNYDYYNNATIWDTSISDHNIPASLIYTSKPAWFGTVPWPPIGPDITPMVNKIPAQLRFEGNYSYLATGNCSSQGGTCCSSGQICSGGYFQSSTDCGSLCCGGAGSSCQANPCGNGICDSGECNTCPADCSLSQCCGDGKCQTSLENCSACPGDCLHAGQVCCSGAAYTGNCCSDSNCTSPQICTNHVCTQLCDNLMLLMHFDNQAQYGESPTKAYDFSGKGNNGTISGATWTNSGKFSGAYTFDGINDLINVSIPSSGSLDIDSNPVTMVAWIKPNTVSVQQAIVARGSSDGVAKGYDGFGFFINSSGRINVGSFGGGNFDGNTILSSNTWYHIAVVINGASSVLYLNGLDDTPASHTVNVIASNISLKIGTARNSSDTTDMRFFNGAIDELAIWNRSLSSQEIQNLYSSNQPIACGISCIHKSDNNPCDGCVDMTELSAFINRWYVNNQDVTMKELIEAIGLWNGGCS